MKKGMQQQACPAALMQHPMPFTLSHITALNQHGVAMSSQCYSLVVEATNSHKLHHLALHCQHQLTRPSWLSTGLPL